MASMREIKRRKTSIQSTAKITRAMKLVSTVKFQKSKGRAENSKPYFDKMYATVSSILARSENIIHPYLTGSDAGKKAVIVLSSNRGLAGGYNANIVRLIQDEGPGREDALIYAVGSKGRDTLARRGYEIAAADFSEVIEAPTYRDAMDIGGEVLRAFKEQEIGELYLAYTSFKNTVTHIPRLLKLLPVNQAAADALVSDEDRESLRNTPMNFETDPEEVIDALVPKYVCSLIYGALMEAMASENGARMNAMDSATDNAEEMIDQLTLSYNRARQGAITQEITEIVSGSEALA